MTTDCRELGRTVPCECIASRGIRNPFLGHNLRIIFPQDMSWHLQSYLYQSTRYLSSKSLNSNECWPWQLLPVSPPVKGVLQFVVVRQLSLGPHHHSLTLAMKTSSPATVRLEVGKTFEYLSPITDTGDTRPVGITQRLHAPRVSSSPLLSSDWNSNNITGITTSDRSRSRGGQGGAGTLDRFREDYLKPPWYPLDLL